MGEGVSKMAQKIPTSFMDGPQDYVSGIWHIASTLQWGLGLVSNHYFWGSFDILKVTPRVKLVFDNLKNLVKMTKQP